MKIKLVKNGIFPITRDINGNLIRRRPDTGYDHAGTLQGEGKLSGIPVLFVRLSGCNLRCTWKNDFNMVDICDTPYSSHNVTDLEEWETEDVVKVLQQNFGNIRHVVISGGEPTIQAAPLLSLISKLKKNTGVHITLETNGVHYVPELANYIDLFSISPKLSSSEPSRGKNKFLDKPVDDNYIRDHKKLRLNTSTIQKYINICVTRDSYYNDQPDNSHKRRTDKDFQLKFVVASIDDELEIKNDFLSRLGFVDNQDVLVMPLGSTPERMTEQMNLAATMAIRNGWRYSPRLQVDIWGNKAGT